MKIVTGLMPQTEGSRYLSVLVIRQCSLSVTNDRQITSCFMTDDKNPDTIRYPSHTIQGYRDPSAY